LRIQLPNSITITHRVVSLPHPRSPGGTAPFEPGITALQALTAAHAIVLNDINAPVTITTGRQLRDHGWPESADTIAVMLDGHCAFQHLPPEGITIWWGAYLGMPQQICIAGPLAEVSERIQAERQAARAAHGWVMDIYLMRRVDKRKVN
jgi:precorrin-6A synthase